MIKIFSALMLAFSPILCAAQQFISQPEPDFNNAIGRIISSVTPSDAFADSACGFVDGKFFAPVSLSDAQKMMTPCLGSVSKRYGAELSIKVGTFSQKGTISAQVESLILKVPSGYPVTSPLMRDLNHGLALRNRKLLGHPVVIERPDPKVSAL